MAGSDQRVVGWHHHRNRINESQAEKKKSLIFFFFFSPHLVSFLRGVSHRDIKQQTRVCVNESEKPHSQQYSIVPARGEKKGGKNPIPWRGHQRHVPACFLKVLLKHVQRPHPPIGKPIPNEVRRLQTGLWLSVDSANARWAQRYGPASISHLAFAHSRNLTQL